MAHGILIALMIAYPLAAILLFRRIWTRAGRWRNLATRCALLTGTLLMLSGCLEYYFANHVAMSDGFGFTLAARNWRARYGNRPLNSHGIRDHEHPIGQGKGKPVLYVVGDSFSAGHGINNYTDRYANRLADQLEDRWQMILVAKGGWGTARQLEELARHRGNANENLTGSEVVLWQYYVNDIEQAGKQAGLVRPDIYLAAPWLLRPVVDNYHLANFLYWGVFRRVRSRELARQYLDYLNRCFDDPQCWAIHRDELQHVVDLAGDRDDVVPGHPSPDRQVIVVVYPNLVDIAGTRGMSDKVAAFFESHEIAVVNMADLLKDKPVKEITVNALDGHPNEWVNKLLADELFRRYFEVASEQSSG
jgi:hypothetical protein